MVLALSIPVNSYSAPVLMAGADGCRNDGSRVSVIGLNSTDIRRETADEQCPAQLGCCFPRDFWPAMARISSRRSVLRQGCCTGCPIKTERIDIDRGELFKVSGSDSTVARPARDVPARLLQGLGVRREVRILGAPSPNSARECENSRVLPALLNRTEI